MENSRFKFRVWNKEKQKLYFWEDLEKTKGNNSFYWCMLQAQNDEKNNILMQCTGLKDKNGKLIYEGDIVQFYDDGILKTMKIVWDNDELDFKAIGLKKSVECYELDFLYLGYIKKEDNLEVIGNIYKNPELLEVENE